MVITSDKFTVGNAVVLDGTSEVLARLAPISGVFS